MNRDTLTYDESGKIVILKDKEGEWAVLFHWQEGMKKVLLVCIDHSGRNSNSTFELGYMGEPTIQFPPTERYKNVPIEEARQHWYTLIASGWKANG